MPDHRVLCVQDRRSQVGAPVGTIGMVGTGGMWEWSVYHLLERRRVVLGSRWPGHVQTRGMAERPGYLGQLRHLGQGVLTGLLEPQQAVAHLGQLRQLGQGMEQTD